ncbi:MAG: response regulator, partial [Campylobacterales bacterium]
SEAVELCRKYPFDIIFMDIDMPVKDGISATHDIRRLSLFREQPAPIIALTALAMQGDRDRILSEGLDGYLAKPLRREKLETVLEKHLSVAKES